MSAPPVRPRLAFLGLGLMGLPMARRLLDAGHELTVWNRSSDKCHQLTGARPAATPAEAAREADLVLLCLLDTAVVEHVVFGEAGVAQGIRRGACVIDFSTIDPHWLREKHMQLREQTGAEWIDAPVSGGVPGAVAGSLTVFCGGDAGRIDAIRGVLQPLAARVTRFGGVGSGLLAKLCNQTIVATQLTAIAEALKLAEASGLEAGALVEALRGGWADSQLLRLFGPRFAARKETPRLGEIRTMLETVQMAGRCAAAAELSLPVAAAAAAVYEALAARGLEHRDLGALMEPG